MTDSNLPDGWPEFVRITTGEWGWFQWIDHGPGRPALVNLYDNYGYFRRMDPDEPTYPEFETTDEAIARIKSKYADAKVERLTWEQRWADEEQRRAK
ncbi:hypothetical protein ACQPW1_10280 [Nocardia sp. CA-128927]|uniref:hypothetical protein n=1 Tax=Nocardia sp. CA-128927 TaxID=3239975 RepID=UPI003D9919B1